MKKEDMFITQNNNLISASYKLGLIERRLLYIGITKLTETNKLDKIIISLDQYNKLYNDIPIKWADLKKCTKDLYDRSIIFITNSTQTYTRWIYYIHFNDDEKKISVIYNNILTGYFLDLKNNFTSYYLDQIKGLKSIYSIRLFEQIIRFKDTGYFKISLDDFRTMFQLQNKYTAYKDMKKRCIDPAIKELNSLDFNVKFKDIRIKRKITFLEFKFIF